MLNNELHYPILRVFERDPTLSQRRMAASPGVSVGKTSYFERGLVDSGLVKVESFRRNRNKPAYAYHLSPRGMTTKTRIIRRFLKAKRQEYEMLGTQIVEFEAEVGEDR